MKGQPKCGTSRRADDTKIWGHFVPVEFYVCRFIQNTERLIKEVKHHQRSHALNIHGKNKLENLSAINSQSIIKMGALRSWVFYEKRTLGGHF